MRCLCGSHGARSRCYGLCLQMKIWPRCWENSHTKGMCQRQACLPFHLLHHTGTPPRPAPESSGSQSHTSLQLLAVHLCGMAEGPLSVTGGVHLKPLVSVSDSPINTSQMQESTGQTGSLRLSPESSGNDAPFWHWYLNDEPPEVLYRGFSS